MSHLPSQPNKTVIIRSVKMFSVDLEYNPSCATQLPQLIYPVLYFCFHFRKIEYWIKTYSPESSVLCVYHNSCLCEATNRVFRIIRNVCYQQYTLRFSECFLITPLTYYRFGTLIPLPVFPDK